MTDRVDLLVVGGGLAAVTVARALRQAGDRRSVIVASAEDVDPYDRPPLSKAVLTGAMSPSDAPLFRPEDIETLSIDLRLGYRAVTLSPDTTEVSFENGDVVHAEDVVIATGSRARIIDAFGTGPGVHYLRTNHDSTRLRSALQDASDVVVIGAGFIGLEVAAVANELGSSVTVLEAAAEPLARVLGPDAGGIVATMHASRGVDIRCGVGVESVQQDGARSRVLLVGGEELLADVVVVGVGAVPCTEWLGGSGVDVDNGVVCDGHGRSTRDRVWAAGDVARWPNAATGLHVRVEQWQAALDQAQVVAANLQALSGGTDLTTWASVPYFWSDQFDVKIQFAGHAGTQSETLESDDRTVVLFGSDDRPTGILTLDNPRLLAKSRRVLASGGGWNELRDLMASR